MERHGGEQGYRECLMVAGHDIMTVTSGLFVQIDMKRSSSNQDLKKRLYQNFINRSPKQKIENEMPHGSGFLKPRMPQDGVLQAIKPSAVYKHGKMILTHTKSTELLRKAKPQELPQEKLSKEARELVEEGKKQIKGCLKPLDIFQFYSSFPEMLQDFFYLNRGAHPYDYEIVTYAQRNPRQYMTISSQGITLYHDKEAEFLSKEEWLQDEKLYHSLQRITFFKEYKLCKNFCIWKNKMRRHFMKEMSSLLKQNLFFAFRHPRNCLLEVQALTSNLVDSFEFLPYGTLDRLPLAQFQATANEHLEGTLIVELRECNARVVESLKQAITEEINKFKEENSIKIGGVNEKGKKEGNVYSQEAILRKQYKRVHKLIRLADNIILEAKINLLRRCMEQLIERISSLRNEEKEPWVNCAAIIQEDTGQITWEPNAETLVALFTTAVKKTIARASQVNEKIFYHQAFAKYKVAESDQKVEDSRNSLKYIIEDSDFYSPLLESIELCLKEEFSHTEAEGLSLQIYVDIFMRHKAITSMRSIFDDNSGVDLSNFVQKWREDERKMSELQQHAKKGSLLFFNFVELGKKIISAPSITLQAFFALLPDETTIRCTKLVRDCRTLLDEISVYPTEISSFLLFNKAVKEAANQLNQIKSRGSQICLMVDLMAKNRLPNLELFMARKNQVMSTIGNLRSKVDESEAKENQSLSKFKKDNDIEIIKINASIKEWSGKFYAMDFDQTKTTTRDSKELLEKLKEMLPHITGLHEQSQKINLIEKELCLPETDFSDIGTLFSTAELVSEVWICREEWKAMMVELDAKHYWQVDCVQVKQRWEEFSNRTIRLSHSMNTFQILKLLITEINAFEMLIDTIAALRSPDLQEKAWKQISEYLGYQMGCENDAEMPFSNQHNPDYTVKWLRDSNILAYKEKIEFIVKKSERQKQLSVCLNEFKFFLANLSFEVVQQSREVVTLATNTLTLRKIEETLIFLYQMVDHQYSASIKTEGENLIKQYEYVQEILAAVMEFGINWKKYEGFFDSNSPCLKQLNKEFKQFSNWENQWKKLIKNITGDSASLYKKICDETTGVNCSRSMIRQMGKSNFNLETISKGLEEYLEKKRAVFPKYYLHSDEQLLHMFAAMTSHEPITPAFVPLLYKHISEIRCKGENKDTLDCIVSTEGELFPLKNVTFKLQSEMEDILKLAEEQIKRRLNSLIKTIFSKYTEEEMSRSQIIMENNAQVVLAVDYIAWVRLAEQTYLCSEPVGDLYDWLQIQNEQIAELRNLLITGTLQPSTRYKLLQLMSQSLYFREKTELFLKQNIGSVDAFQWEHLPKLCLSITAPEIYLKQLTHKIPYCYQFLGNSVVSYTVPQTERVWVNIAQALSSRDLICLRGETAYQIETLKELGYLLAQSVDTVHIGAHFTCKGVDRYLSAAVYTGNWVVISLPFEGELLSLVVTQLQAVRKALSQNAVTIQLNRVNIPINPNCAFFVSFPDNYSPPSLHDYFRAVHFVTPDLSKILGAMSDCEGVPSQFGFKVEQIVREVKETFMDSYCLDFSITFLRKIYRCSLDTWQRNQNQKGMELVILQAIDRELLHCLKGEDTRIYESLKNAIVLGYDRLKWRGHGGKSDHPQTKEDIHSSRLESRVEFIELAKTLEDSLNGNHLGVIVTGDILSGKSTLIDYVAKMHPAIILRKIYHNAHLPEEVFYQRDNQNPGLLSRHLSSTENVNWVVMDGEPSQQYLQMFGKSAEKYIMPKIGLHGSSDSAKIILETVKLDNMPPSIVGNHSIIYVGNNICPPEAAVKQLMQRLEAKKQLTLGVDTITEMNNLLTGYLCKFEAKGNFKNRSIGLIYSASSMEVTYRCCRLIENIFAMNCDSIHEKEKNMKKMVEKFVTWAIFWSISPIVKVDDLAKLEKYIEDVCHSEAYFTESLSRYIVYPGCGLEVQPIVGLRTQSSLSIPEKGILTNVLKSGAIQEPDTSKTKFYEDIIISECHLVRVNTEDSNIFSYFAQLSSNNDIPLLLYGPPHSGKKGMVQLYAKNMKFKAQVHSIRFMFHRNNQLAAQIEKPYRRFAGLKGLYLKSPQANRKLLLSIEDVQLPSQDSTDLLRMICNQKGFYGKQMEWVKLAYTRLVLISTRLGLNDQVSRLLPRMEIVQPKQKEHDRIEQIFGSYLKTWCSFVALKGDVAKLFSNESGDGLLNATMSIFRLFEDMFQASLQKNGKTVETLLLKPRMGDVARMIANICKTSEAAYLNMSYYFELWLHETIRVFGDRLRDPAHKDVFFKELKKESLLKFKENFNQSRPLFFSSMNSETDSFTRIDDIGELQSEILTLQQSISLPLKLLFSELFEQILRIHRLIGLEGSSMMLLSCNKRTAAYLVELVCQLCEYEFHSLHGSALTAEKHVEPTLHYKGDICIAECVDQMTEEQKYQFSCLMNSNYYDFAMKPQLREKIKSLLTKKEQKPEKKQKTLSAFKTKTDFSRPEQLLRDEQIDMQIADQFMIYTHFFLMGNPTSELTRSFLEKEVDMVGLLHLNWIDIPEEALVKVSKDILIKESSTSQEIAEKQKMARKVMRIHQGEELSGQYFNDLLCIVDASHAQIEEQNEKINHHIMHLQRAIQNKDRVVGIISDCEIKCTEVQIQLDAVNVQLETVNQSIEGISNRLAEAQMAVNAVEADINTLKAQQLQLNENQKKIKESKESLELLKKKALKTITIAKDYLQLFVPNPNLFEQLLAKQQHNRDIMHDRVYLLWSILCYLLNENVDCCISKVNRWIGLLEASIQPVSTPEDLLVLFQEIFDLDFTGLELLSSALQFKAKLLLYLLRNYEETVHCSKLIRVDDRSGMLVRVLEKISPEQDTPDYALIKSYDSFSKEMKMEIEFLLKTKNGLIHARFEDESQIEQFEQFLQSHKLIPYYHKIVVFTSKHPHVTIDCDEISMQKYLGNASLNNTDPFLGMETKTLYKSMLIDSLKKKEVDGQFIKSCASIDFSSETYSQEISKLKCSGEFLANSLQQHTARLMEEKLQAPDRLAINIISQCMVKANPKCHTLKILDEVYKLTKDTPENLEELVQDILACNLGINKMSIEQYVRHTKPWFNQVCVVVSPTLPGRIEPYKSINLFNPNQLYALSSSIEQDSTQVKMLYNYIHQLHFQVVQDVVIKMSNDLLKESILIVVGQFQLNESLSPIAYCVYPHMPTPLDIHPQITLVLPENFNKQEAPKVGKMLENLGIYLKSLESFRYILAFLSKNLECVRDRKDLMKLLFDAFQEKEFEYVWRIINEETSCYQKQSADEQSFRIKKQTRILDSEIQFILEDLPFEINIGEFAATKEPLCLQIISKCYRLNKELKTVKEMLANRQESRRRLDYMRNTVVLPSQQAISKLTNQAALLKKGLTNLHILSQPVGLSCAKIHSTVQVKENIFSLASCFKMGTLPLSYKMLKAIQMRACRKMNKDIGAIKLVWKISNQVNSFQEMGAMPELTVLVEGFCQGKSLSLLLCPREGQAQVANYVSVRSPKGSQLGKIEIAEGYQRLRDVFLHNFE